jgi:hypothetical protein
MICNQLATTSPKQCAARAFLQVNTGIKVTGYTQTGKTGGVVRGTGTKRFCIMTNFLVCMYIRYTTMDGTHLHSCHLTFRTPIFIRKWSYSCSLLSNQSPDWGYLYHVFFSSIVVVLLSMLPLFRDRSS